MSGIHRELSGRIDYIDLAKGFCILAVLWYHALYCRLETPLDFAMAIFRMPFYYFLSGLFFKMYGGLADFSLRKVNKLLVPFLFFYLLSYLAGMVCDFLGFYEKGIVQDPFHWTQIFDIFVTEKLTYNAPLWFFISLFEVNILFYGLLKLCREKNLPLILSSVALGCTGFYLMSERIDLPYYLDTSMRALPFFASGYFVRKYTGLLHPHRYDRFLPVILPVLAVVLYFGSPRLPYENIIGYYGIAMCGILLMMGIAKSIRYVPGISYIGRYSLVVLGTHMFLLAPCKLLVGKLGLAAPASDLLLWCATILASLVVIPVMIRLFPALLAQKDLFPLRWMRVKESDSAL